jgi:hypothetical protein
MVPWLMVSAIQVVELSVSSVVHMFYGLYIFSSAVAGDLTQSLSESIFKPKSTIEVKQIDQEKTTDVNDLPPIVLVHGIFGFGKGVKFTTFSAFLHLCVFIVSLIGFAIAEIRWFIILRWSREEG